MANPRYRIIKAGPDFVLRRKSLPGFPMIVGPLGVEEATHVYLTVRSVESSAKAGTILDEARILKDWLEYLGRKKVSLDQAGNKTLTDFTVMSFKAGITDRRIQRKINVVFAFYLFASKNLEGCGEILEDPLADKVGPKYPISVEISWRLKKDGTRAMRFSSRVKMPTILESRARPTPSDEGVERVTDTLLESSPTSSLGHARWLMARWMFRSTLRCAGVASLTVDAIAEALHREGLRGAEDQQVDLIGMISMPDEQRRVLDKVRELRLGRRTAVFPMVQEKGGKRRRVPLPLDHLEHNLEFVWNVRPHLLRGREGGRALFPSLKTGDHMRPNSIGNLVKLSFKKAGVAGSAHRLRAVSAEGAVRQAFYRAVAIHGSAFDRDSIVMEAAEQLGHADPSSLMHYLNNMIGEINKEAGFPILIDDPDTAARLKTLNKQLRENEELQAALKEFFSRHSIDPAEQLGLRGLREHLADLARHTSTKTSSGEGRGGPDRSTADLQAR